MIFFHEPPLQGSSSPIKMNMTHSYCHATCYTGAQSAGLFWSTLLVLHYYFALDKNLAKWTNKENRRSQGLTH